MTLYETYERCNETELYQIARAAGLRVVASAKKDELIKFILGEVPPPPEANDIDEWRLAIMGFVIEHRKRLEVQLRCPAKSMDPRACFQCVDEQVVSCLVDNKTNLNLIKLHKKPIDNTQPTGDPMTTAATVLNPENAPRDKEKLKGAGSFQMRKLADSLGMLSDTEKQMAFGKLSPDDRANEIFNRLVEWDKGHGKTTTPGANTAPSSSTTTADAPGTSVTTVDPAAFKAAQDATSNGPGLSSTKRQPKTELTGAKSNGAATGGESDLTALVVSIGALAESAKGQGTVVSQALGELRGVVQAVAPNIEGRIASIQTAILGAMQEQTNTLKYMLMVVLTIAEERGVASRFEILADAVAESANLDAMLREIKGSSGKAA